jgi:hypothetical protein
VCFVCVCVFLGYCCYRHHHHHHHHHQPRLSIWRLLSKDLSSLPKWVRGRSLLRIGICWVGGEEEEAFQGDIYIM